MYQSVLRTSITVWFGSTTKLNNILQWTIGTAQDQEQSALCPGPLPVQGQEEDQEHLCRLTRTSSVWTTVSPHQTRPVRLILIVSILLTRI